MSQVFISYKREQRDKAEALAAAIAAAGFTVWWDIDLLPGDRFADEIRTVIKASKAVVVLWSEEAVRSDFVRSEALLALHLELLIPVRLDSCELPLPFGVHHTLDLTGWSGWRNDPVLTPLVAAIRRKVGRSAQDTAGTDDPSEGSLRLEVENWKRAVAEAERNPDAYRDYLERHGPKGIFAELAKRRTSSAPLRQTGPSYWVLLAFVAIPLLVVVAWLLLPAHPIVAVRTDDPADPPAPPPGKAAPPVAMPAPPAEAPGPSVKPPPEKADLKFSLSTNLTISDFDATKSFQIARLSGNINVVNNGTSNAIIDAVLVENTAVASQLYMMEGCGSLEFGQQAPPIAADRSMRSFHFAVPYTIGFVHQVQDEPEIGVRVEPIKLGAAAFNANSVTNESANIYVFWSDPSGRYFSVVRHLSQKRVVRYIESQKERASGGSRDPYCFNSDLRSAVGLGNTFSAEGQLRTGMTKRRK